MDPSRTKTIDNSNHISLLGAKQVEPDGSRMTSSDDRFFYQELIRTMRLSGQCLRSDKEQPKLLEKPIWYDERLFKNAQSLYGRHFMGMNFAHLSGLLLLVRVDSIYSTLNATGESSQVSKLFKRYYNTVKHVKTWYEGDIFQEHSEAHRSLLMVRGMHNKVSGKLNDKTVAKSSGQNSIEMNGNCHSMCNRDSAVHISEYDILLTQFAFIGFIITNGEKMGFLADFNEFDKRSLIHFWRIIGYYLGASEKYNLCSYELREIEKFCQAIISVEYKESMLRNGIRKEPGIMSVNIVRSVKFIPMLTVYGIMTYLYEILDFETNELENRKTWYSTLSYALIKLVMSRLLAYKPFRWFNNGLTRLSLFLVGKVDDWFANYLASKYGRELKI